MKATQLVQNIFLTASKTKFKTSENETKKETNKCCQTKNWFDNECKVKRKFVRKFSNLKHRDPNNLSIRKQYQSAVKEYKATLQKEEEIVS